MYQSVSEVTETLNIEEKFYEVESLKFNLVNETSVTIDAMNRWGSYKRIANFNFLDNVGWYYTINHKQVEVKRFSTIMNYLFKMNDGLFWSTTEVNQAKINTKRIRQVEERNRKKELKDLDNNKALQFIKLLESNKASYNTVNLIKNKELYELKAMIDNTFKYASKKVLRDTFNATIRYKNTLHDEHTCKERRRKLINYSDFYKDQLEQKEVVTVELINDIMYRESKNH